MNVCHDAWLTTAQAVRLSGRSKTVIGDACRSGVLRFEKVPTGAKNVPAYRIDPESFARWLVASPPPPDRKPWSAADDAAIEELYRSGCTHSQIGAHLGRSAYSVNTRLVRLGICQGQRPGQKPSTRILIARTCTSCGQMRDADQMAHQGKRPTHKCKRCVAKYVQAKRPKQPYRSVLLKLYEVTRSRATNHGKPYCEADLRVLSDKTKSPLDAALELGRSLYSVQTKRTSMGYVTRTVTRIGDRPTLWRLDIALGERTVAEVFRMLGEPVPEQMWDWNDEAVAS